MFHRSGGARMIRIRGAAQARQIDDPSIREIVEQRFAQVCNGKRYDPEVHGEMIVVEPGDKLASLEGMSGCPIASNPYDESRFPDPDFTPVCEAIEEHATCYEMVFILNDDGFGVLIFVPEHPGIDRELLSLCRTYAVKPAKRQRS